MPLNKWCRFALECCDLRYPESEENAFQASMHRSLAISCGIVACAFLPGLWLVSLPEFLAEVRRAEAPFRWSVDDPRTLMYSVHILINLAGFFIVFTSGLTLANGWFRKHFELLMTSVFAAIAALVPFANYWFAAFACGVHPDNVWLGNARDGETTVLICTIALASTCCHFIPIRICRIWLIPACGFTSFALSSIVLGTPYPRNQYVNVLFLGLLDGFACLGALRNENLARKRWSGSLRIIEQQKELHESEAIGRAMHQMAESLVDAVVCLGPRYKITAWDPKLTESFGNMRGGKYISLLTEGSRPSFQKGLSRAAKTGILQSIPVALLRADGEQDANVLVVFAGGQQHTYIVGMVLKGPWLASDGDPEGMDARREATALDSDLESVASFGSVASSIHSSQTTLSGDIFRCVDGEDLHGALSQIEELGLKEHWAIDRSALKLSAELLGRGGFGTVLAGNLHGSPVAVKFCHGSWKAFRSLLHELRIMRFVRHPNLVVFYGACIDTHALKVALVFDFIDGSSLDKYIETRSTSHVPCSHSAEAGLNARYCCKVLLDICSALRYLHSSTVVPIVHGDISPKNILVKNTESLPQAVLIDFGLAQKIKSHHNISLGRTLRYAAPELFQQGHARPNVSTDVYAFGCIVYYVLTSKKPCAEMDNEELYLKLRCGSALPQLLWPPEAYFLRAGKKLCDECTQLDPRHRVRMQDIHMRLSSWLPPRTLFNQCSEDEMSSWGEVMGFVTPAPNEDLAEVLHPPPNLICERYPETSDAAKQKTLFQTALTWNLAISRSDCCHAHVVQQELIRIARRMQPGLSCTWDFLPSQTDTGFCEQCGVFRPTGARVDGNRCLFCEGALHRETTTSL